VTQNWVATIYSPEFRFELANEASALVSTLEAARRSQKLLDGTPATLRGMIRARENLPPRRFGGPLSERSNRAVCALQQKPFNTYQPVYTNGGRWVVEWAVDGGVIGYVPGTFDTKFGATVAAFNLARLEWAEGT